MFERINTLKMADGLVAHSTQRQRLIAGNIANADTPGFHARDLGSFSAEQAEGTMALRQTSARHLPAGNWGISNGEARDAGSEASPNGNTVSIEDEIFRLADARREFDLALSVTKSSLALMRTGLGRKF